MPNRDETAYAYDANGNVVSDGTYRYAYDYRNRLARVVRLSDSRVIETMAYDVLGRRTSRASNSTTVRAVYAGDRMIEEYTRLHTAPFSLIASYVWGERHSDDAVAMVRSEGTYYYHADRLGSVLALTSSAGATVERYSYDAYGVPSVWDDSLGRYRSMGDSRVWNVLLYAGRPYDRITWLSDMRARRYSPGLGRFTSRDPIGMGDNVNLYLYCKDSPVNYTDRDGKRASEILSKSTQLISLPFNAVMDMGEYLSENQVPIDDIRALNADKIQIYRTTPYTKKVDHPLLIHTDIIFFKDGKPVAILWSAPLEGWTFYNNPEMAQFYIENGKSVWRERTDVEGCISALENSVYSNAPITLYGRATACWAGVAECYFGTKK